MNGPKRDPPFKVLIIGAGVSGLTLAHSLHKAGVDYLVFDKHPVALTCNRPAWGASITIHPLGSRILHQLGLLEAFDAKCTPMHNFWNRGPDGKNFNCEPFFDQVTRRNGYLSYTISRQGFLQTLYDALPDKSKVIENARLQDVIEEDGSVKAVMTDGSTYDGDLVVGADGVHSAVREIMWRHANQLLPGSITVTEKRRIRTSYNCLLGISPMQPGLGTEDMHCVSNDKFSFLFLTQPDCIFFIVHCKLPGSRVIEYPDRARYTEADAEAKAAEIAGCPISETLVFGDIWNTRIRGHLVSLEEGVLERWFSGRTVLCGDAAHKFTPNAALGGSMAMESAVVLANELYVAISRHPNKKPNNMELRAALQRYQDFRIPRLKEGLNVSWMLTRVQAYDGFLMYLIQRWIIPTISLDFIAGVAGKFCSEAPKLSYVPFKERRGTLAWKDYEKEEIVKKTYKKSHLFGINGLAASVVMSTLVLYSLSIWIFAGKSPRVLVPVSPIALSHSG